MKPLLLILALFAVYGFSGAQDVKDADLEQHRYCQMAEQGVWPMKEYCE